MTVYTSHGTIAVGKRLRRVTRVFGLKSFSLKRINVSADGCHRWVYIGAPQLLYSLLYQSRFSRELLRYIDDDAVRDTRRHVVDEN